MPSFISLILAELRKNNCLRIGLWAIIAILLMYTVLVLNDYHKQLQDNHAKALTRLKQLHSIAEQTQWPERATQAQELRTQLTARLWQADTKGLAQAIFQTWLQEEMFFAKIKKPMLNVEEAVNVPKYPKLWKVTAKLKASFIPKGLLSLLKEIAKNPRLTVTERLEIRHHVRKPKFTLVISAYFQGS